MEKLTTKKGGKALYIQIKDIYRDKILSDELKLGDKIESEMEIQQKYNVSRITARQAILDLEKEGMVKRGRGKGTFVIWQPAIEEELSHIMSFTKEMEHRNRVPGTKGLSVSIEPLPEGFGSHSKEKMYCIRRVRTADDVKLVYFVSYFPLSTNLPLDPDEYSESIYEILDYTGTGLPVRIEEKISAQMPDKEVRDALNIPKTLPVLVRQRLSYSATNELIEYTTCYYRGDLYTYSISTTNQSAE